MAKVVRSVTIWRRQWYGWLVRLAPTVALLCVRYLPPRWLYHTAVEYMPEGGQ